MLLIQLPLKTILLVLCDRFDDGRECFDRRRAGVVLVNVTDPGGVQNSGVGAACAVAVDDGRVQRGVIGRHEVSGKEVVNRTALGSFE